MKIQMHQGCVKTWRYCDADNQLNRCHEHKKSAIQKEKSRGHWLQEFKTWTCQKVKASRNQDIYTPKKTVNRQTSQSTIWRTGYIDTSTNQEIKRPKQQHTTISLQACIQTCKHVKISITLLFHNFTRQTKKSRGHFKALEKRRLLSFFLTINSSVTVWV